MKKFLSFFLSLVMCLSSLPAAVFADETVTVDFVNIVQGDTERYAIKEVVNGEPYGELPSPGNVTFLGWFTEATGGEQITADTVVNLTEGQTLYGHWSPVTVLFDPQGGECDVTEMAVTYGNYYELPTPTRTGFVFTGWYKTPEAAYSDKVYPATVQYFTEDTTVYAQWKPDMCSVTSRYSPVSAGTEGMTMGEPYGDRLRYTPVWGENEFLGWFTEAEGGEELTPDSLVPFEEKTTIYAHWKRKLKVRVYYSAADSQKYTEKTLWEGEPFGEFPEPEGAESQWATFGGWYAGDEYSINAGTAVGPLTEETPIEAISASDEIVSVNMRRLNRNTVEFYPCYEDQWKKTERTYTEGATVGSLPEPECTMEGISFVGWYDASTGGNEVTEATSVNGLHAVYARFAPTGDFIISADHKLIDYRGSGGDVVIPDGVTAIESSFYQDMDGSRSGLYENQDITSLTLPEGITEIKQGTFSGWKNLKTVRFPKSLKVVGRNAFTGCDSLEDLIFQGGPESIGAFAFSDCPSLKKVEIPNADCKVDGYAFEHSLDTADVLLAGRTLKDISRENSATGAWESVLSTGSYNHEYAAANTAFVSKGVEPQYYENTIVTSNIQALSDSVCAGRDNDRDKARAIHDWVTENIYYDYEAYHAGTYRWMTAQELYEQRKGVCCNYSVLFQALCWAQEIPCVAVAGSPNHAWDIVKVDGTWQWVDCTWDSGNAYDCGQWSKGGSSLEYFLCPTEYFSMRHRTEWYIYLDGINADIPSQTAEETKQNADEQLKHFSEDEKKKTLREQTQKDKTLSTWAASEVDEAIGLDLVPENLCSLYNFDITRQEFASLMVSLVEAAKGENIAAYLSEKGLSTFAPFTDTSDYHVRACYNLGIVKGISDTLFNPSGSITRQEAATMLTRTAKVLGISGGTPQTFADEDSFPDWAKEGIRFVSGLTGGDKKVMEGTGNNTFSPLGSYTREQAIATSLRLFKCL